MRKTLVPLLLQILRSSYILGDGSFECGDHGRFEYCIDEIPGCVIGCHCHPGYYFDTDTKICELNSRLIEHHRRNNMVKPAQAQKVTPDLMYNTEPASSTNRIEEHANDLTKDTNDLGDWLYNQFFKTIENQVINKTDDENIMTRRSGSQQPIKNPKNIKKWRKRKPLKQRKNKQLRRKLLRITENDSMFDISSKSSSDSSDSSSSSDLSSMEYEVEEKSQHKHDDGEHGHKKIVVINKKPKQPLPSFIFLPNLDTPYYPPIGLPPPPIIPMYPMVPVPPVPLCPIAGCENDVGKNNIAIVSSTPTSTTAPTLATFTSTGTTSGTITSVQSSLATTSTDTAITIGADNTTNVPKTDAKTLRLKNKKRKKIARLLKDEGRNYDQGMNTMTYNDRQNILKHLKQKMPSANFFDPSWKRNKKLYANKFINQNKDIEYPFLDNNIVNNEYSNKEINSKLLQRDETFPDFKYITELIHRVDVNNNSNGLPPIEYNPLEDFDTYQSPNLHKSQYSDYSVPFDILDGRRKNRPKYRKSDESYYANLGRQIATMIRNTDDRENVEIENTPENSKNDLYLNNSPTSFWERSVRSPLALLKTKSKKYEYLKKSNELLFDIENKVEIIASTTPTLSLLEIENIVNVVEAAKRDVQHKNSNIMRNSIISNKNLNIDLWPQKPTENLKKSYKSSFLPYSNEIETEKKVSNLKVKTNFPSVSLHSVQKFITWNNGNVNQINQSNNNPTTSKPSNKNNYLNITETYHNLGKPNIIQHTPERTIPFSQNNIRQTFLNHQINPYILSHRKYFQDNYNYYVNQKEDLPHLPPIARFAVKPSYFPDVNQFAYIEQFN